MTPNNRRGFFKSLAVLIASPTLLSKVDLKNKPKVNAFHYLNLRNTVPSLPSNMFDLYYDISDGKRYVFNGKRWECLT